MRFCFKIKDEMILGSLRFRILVVMLEKFLDVIYCVIRGIEEVFVSYMCAGAVIGSSVLNALLDVFHL